jgi:transcription antitermination factor NusA-like protein
MEVQAEAVVVPLVPFAVEPTTEVMLRMLLEREALIIHRVPAQATTVPSGMVAQTSGSFAKAIGNAMSQIGRTSSAEGLYRVVLPTGSVTRDLVPAIGGGFRGMVRGAESTKLAGHARLIPAVAGAGAAVAAGPLIATVALAVGGEMLAQHQINKKLDSIKSAVYGVQRHLNAQDRAVLITAEQEAHKVVGYLLDQANVPAIAAAGHAFADLATLTNRHIDQLDRWSEIAASHDGAGRVNGSDLMAALVGKRDDQVQEFERSVAQAYEAIALRARVVVLEKVAAEFANPDRSLPHVEEVLRRELSVLAGRQGQLMELLDDLSAMQIDGSKVPIAMAGKRTIGVRTSFGRLSRALHAAPAGLPLLTDSDQTIVELAPTAKGLEVISPGAI